MKKIRSYTTERFRRSFQKLPSEVQRVARKAFKLWRKDPSHKSLQFKKVHASEPIYSVRVGISWRALGVMEKDVAIWFWIGSHADYDKLLGDL